MIRRQAFLAVGGFDHSYKGATIEDIELGYRLTKVGRKIRLAAEIQVTHAKRYTLVSLIRSDIFHRAVPWTVLMLKEHTARSDLNTTWSNALSVFLAWLLIISLAGNHYISHPGIDSIRRYSHIIHPAKPAFLSLCQQAIWVVVRPQDDSHDLALLPIQWFRLNPGHTHLYISG